jgi:hypothetical protein
VRGEQAGQLPGRKIGNSLAIPRAAIDARRAGTTADPTEG